jgi:hypothetical protein
MRPIKPDVIIALDPGGSLTKIIYQPLQGVPQVLVMPPQVIATQRQAVALQSQWGDALLGPPESSAWVAFNQQVYAVGVLAQDLRASSGLRSLKWEKAVYKTLAALWVIQQRLKLKARFKVALTCVLPAGEFEDRGVFEAALRQALEEFETPTGMMQVTLQRFDCRPEAFGVAALYGQQQPLMSSLAFIMLGYRNASLLLMRAGKMQVGVTSELGFVRCLERVSRRCSGVGPDNHLASAITEARRERNAVPYLRLANYSDIAIKEQKARAMVQIVAEEKAAYAEMVLDWLDEVLPTEDRMTLVFCGGTTDEIRPYLDRYCPEYAHQYQVISQFPESFDAVGLGDRLADVYGIFLCLQQTLGLEVVSAA